MLGKKKIQGFLHYRTDLGDGVRTGVVFGGCTEICHKHCDSFRFIPEHDFSEDTLEDTEYSPEELVKYLREEKVMYYARKVGVTFLGKEPLRDPFFCEEVAKGLHEAGIGLQIITCGMCSMTAFERLDGLVEMYILRVFPPFSPKNENFVFDRAIQAKQVICFLEARKTPYRLLIPVTSSISKSDTESFADYLLSLDMLKSVMLDFSDSSFSDEKKMEIKSIFLKRKIPGCAAYFVLDAKGKSTNSQWNFL